MKIAILILFGISWVALQEYLSKRENYIFGLIIPIVIVISGVLLFIFKVPHGTERDWIFKFVMLLSFSMSAYFRGRERVKKKKKKELEKMTIKDL